MKQVTNDEEDVKSKEGKKRLRTPLWLHSSAMLICLAPHMLCTLLSNQLSTAQQHSTTGVI